MDHHKYDPVIRNQSHQEFTTNPPPKRSPIYSFIRQLIPDIVSSALFNDLILSDQIVQITNCGIFYNIEPINYVATSYGFIFHKVVQYPITSCFCIRTASGLCPICFALASDFPCKFRWNTVLKKDPISYDC